MSASEPFALAHRQAARDRRRLHHADLDRAFAIAASQAADGTAPYVILAVADAEGVVRAEAFAGPDAPGVRGDSLCTLASITKPVIATAAMRLVADGRLALGDPVSLHLPEFAAPGKPEVTVWHLLTHTSGIADFDLQTIAVEGWDRADVESFVIRAPIGFAPGTRYAYVSSTFDLLGMIVERITREPFADHVRRTIFEPLGMADTTFEPGDAWPRVAPTWIAAPADGGERQPVPFSIHRAFARLRLAGAGLFSTASDLVRFGRAMLRGGEIDGTRILAPAFVELMTREQTTDGLGASASDPLLADHYALGWGKPDPLTSPLSSRAFGHGGVTGTRLWVDPDRDLVIAYLTGVWNQPSRPVDLVVQAVCAAGA